MILMLLGCPQPIPETVTITGYVTNNPASEDVVVEARVTVMDLTFEATDSTETDEDGFFSVTTTAGAPVYFDLEADGFARTGFSGLAGVEDWTVPAGQLWLESEDDLSELEAQYAGCPGVGEDGGVIAGEIRFYLEGYQPDNGEWPLANTGFARAYSSEGESWDGCHLDETGSSYDPEALVTGDSGQYAIFGGPAGPVTLALGYVIEDVPVWASEYHIFVPDGGIAPLWPSYVPFPQ